MGRQPRAMIEGFGKRARWAMKNLRPASAELGVILTTNDLFDALFPILKRSRSTLSARTWARYLSGESAPDEHVLDAIEQIYPQLLSNGQSLLRCPFDRYSAFSARVAAENRRWIDASTYLAGHRRQAEALGRRLYAEFDELDTLPLIGRKGWILQTPVELRRDAWPAAIQVMRSHNTDERKGFHFPPGVPDYLFIKTQLRTKKRQPFNGDCYVAKAISGDGKQLTLSLGCGKYYDYINTCEAHAAILADALASSTDEDTAMARARAELEGVGWRPSDIAEWNSRSAFIGVNCLLIVRNYDFKGKDVFFLHRRGTDTMEAQGVYHVAPAGGHQPLTRNFGNDEEENFWFTAARELLEEIFHCAELADHNRGLAEHFKEEKRTDAIFRALFMDDATRIFFLGIGLDPATTKPEALLTIVLDWPRASNHYHSNTYKTLHHELGPNYEGVLDKILLSRETLVGRAMSPAPGYTMLPAGEACLRLAAAHLPLLIGRGF